MMLVWVLVLTALLASDVTGTTDSLGLDETQQDLEMRNIVKGDCAENWFYFSSLKSCYRYFPGPKSWPEAEEYCKRQPCSGHLATVISSEHHNFILEVINAVNTRKPATWIGLNERCQEGTFRWSDGFPYIYGKWEKGEPNNHGGDEDCVHVNHGDNEGWNDLPCESKRDFVCSYKVDCA